MKGETGGCVGGGSRADGQRRWGKERRDGRMRKEEYEKTLKERHERRMDGRMRNRIIALIRLPPYPQQ